MAQITKHIGRIGDRKVAVVFREVPGEPHMSLVVFTQVLNRHLHDSIMECIQSESGQQGDELADVLNRVYTKDGKIILQQLHIEGQLKKVQSENVIMTPTPSNKTDIKLSELNKLINEIKAGGDAAKKMADIDASMGLQDPQDVARRKREAAETPAAPAAQPVTSAKRVYSPNDMSDAAIAWRLQQQAEKMAAEARGLLAESQRIMLEATALDPSLAPQPAPAPKITKTRAKKSAPAAEAAPTSVAADPAPRRGRPAKATSKTVI